MWSTTRTTVLVVLTTDRPPENHTVDPVVDLWPGEVGIGQARASRAVFSTIAVGAVTIDES
ncbi:hypothetical protein GCM10017691_18750 [Pseudonocardia petroleophila]